MDSKKKGEFKSMSRSLFIESLVGNIKEKYFFEKKLGSGGYGAVYLAKNKVSGKYRLRLLRKSLDI
jgi:serine/threonine protein kinase